MAPEIDCCAPAAGLFIAVPALTGQITVETAGSLIGAVRALALAGIRAHIAFHSGCCFLDHARNMLAGGFLASDASDMLFVDADVGFPPQAAVAIARAQRPFVAGVYPLKADEIKYPVQFDAAEVRNSPDGLIEAASVPTGFLRLNRTVVERLSTGVYEYKGQQHPALFDCGVRDGRYLGEDADLCRRWRAKGGRVWMMPELSFTHTGPKTWTGSWGAWMRTQIPA